MKPIESYQHIAARARRLLEFHDGLVNIRSRRIRSDWKASFCRLMHWRQASAIERVDTRQAVVVLRDGAQLKPEDFSRESTDDLLRSSLVLGISALDRYAHERVVKGVVAALRGPALNQKQRDFAMPITLTLKVTDAFAQAQREKRVLRPANEVRKAIQTALHKRPLQSWREIESAFELLGITNLTAQMQSALAVADMKQVKAQLGRVVQRRNAIVHEGDLVKHKRGGKVRCAEIEPKFVREALDFLDFFVGGLDAVT